MRISDWSSDVCSSDLLYRHEFEKNGRRQSVLLFSNPDSKKFRENLTIKLSLDNGKTWQEQNQLLLDEGRGRGYSCLTSVGEDYIGILYESSQADLVFQKISLSSLLEGISEQHTSELQSLMRISYAVARSKKNNKFSIDQ